MLSLPGWGSQVKKLVQMTQSLPVPMSGHWEQAPDGHGMASAETGPGLGSSRQHEGWEGTPAGSVQTAEDASWGTEKGSGEKAER